MNYQTKVIGVLGEAGAGKTTFCHYMEDKHNAFGIIGDDVAHEVLKNPVVVNMLVKVFNNSIIDENGYIDRGTLGSLVFNDKSSLAKLNDIVHPVIRNVMKELVDSNMGKYPIIFLDGAALIESGVIDLCEYIVYITANPEIRERRLVDKRGVLESKAKAIIQAQPEPEYYLSYADKKFDTSIEFSNIEEDIDDWVKELVI